MNYKELQIALIKRDLSVKDLSDLLNITYHSMNNKLTNKTEFKYSELKKLKTILKLSNEEFLKIFNF